MEMDLEEGWVKSPRPPKRRPSDSVVEVLRKELKWTNKRGGDNKKTLCARKEGAVNWVEMGIKTNSGCS